ncbi:MAG: OmpH family outer membrane protein [Filimonas sp.]|nr:OmpH family outer membrane protein [Filimonas sp.]
MKKVVFSMLAVVGLLLGATTSKAQTAPKVGFFDIEIMMQALPEYRKVDSLIQIYQRDSLGAEYDVLNSEFKRLDSTYKIDSAANKSKAILDYSKEQRQRVGMQIVYWQQIAQQKVDQKMAILAQPLYERVATAYKKVLDANKYLVVLKPGAIEFLGSGNSVDNIFVKVAKEMKITLPAELGGGQPDAEDAPKKPAPGAGGARPTTPKK